MKSTGEFISSKTYNSSIFSRSLRDSGLNCELSDRSRYKVGVMCSAFNVSVKRSGVLVSYKICKSSIFSKSLGESGLMCWLSDRSLYRVGVECSDIIILV